MAEVLTTRFQVRRGYTEAWERNNPILASGEPGFALDANILKIGDGVTRWNELKSIGGSGSGDISDESINALINEIKEIKEVTIPEIRGYLEEEERRAKAAEEELNKKFVVVNNSVADLITKTQILEEKVNFIVDPEAGILKLANEYTDKAIANLTIDSGYDVDNETIKVNDNKAYVAKVSTDVLEQGEMELILYAGSSNI